MPRLLLVLCVMMGLLNACGKVTQDLGSSSKVAHFKTARFAMSVSHALPDAWHDVIATNNTTMVYSVYQGITLDTGLTQLAWSSASVQGPKLPSDNAITNYDMKKNTVTSARYQQGLIQMNQVSTHNYQLQATFKKIRPNHDYYAWVSFLNKQHYRMMVTDTIPTASVQVTRHDHLISALFLTHLSDESYSRTHHIPLAVFQAVIPTDAVTPTLNIYPKNTVRLFKPDQPVFNLKSPLLDALLNTVTLAYHSDEVDTLDYLTSKKAVFSNDVMQRLSTAVSAYSRSRQPTSNATNP